MPSKRIVRDVWLRRLRLERSYRPPVLARHPEWVYDDLLRLVVGAQLRERPDFTFVQVGAFDGVANDPIHALVEAYGLRGIVVEPQAGAWELLRRHYAEHPQVAVVNAAIGEEAGTRDFFSASSGPIQQASFSRAHLRRHRVPADQIVCRKVRCLTMMDLLREHGLGRLDLVQVDAEGFDDEVVRTIDFAVVRPCIIRFEHAHLTAAKSRACVESLASRGYRFIPERRDLIALRDD